MALRQASMKRAITYLLLILFVGSQAGDLVRLCAEWLVSGRPNPRLLPPVTIREKQADGQGGSRPLRAGRDSKSP